MGSGRRVDPFDRSDPAHRKITSYEASLAPDDRKQRGVHYTPPELARFLVARALPQLGRSPLRVCDPTCGGGTFLLAVADALADSGIDPVEIVSERLYGADVDADALALARKLLVDWAKERSGRSVDDISVPGLVQADVVTGADDAWGGRAEFDLIVGNPPFLSQLRSRTARTSESTKALRERFGSVAAYADTASLILLASVGMLAEGGVATMIQPQSFLAARDTSGVRDSLLDAVDVVELWSSDASYFDAAVRVCAVTVARATDPSKGRSTGDGDADNSNGRSTRTSDDAKQTEVVWSGTGEEFSCTRRSSVRSPQKGESWGPAFATAIGVPVTTRTGGMVLGDLATATAGFRDEFYALVDACKESSEDSTAATRADAEDPDTDDVEAPRLVTVGMIDPCHLTWGEVARKLGGVKRLAPRLDLTRLAASNPGVHRWATGRLVPKILIATQTRIIEAAVDGTGACIPVTPVISVEPKPGWELLLTEHLAGATEHHPDLWWLLAAISAPSVAAHAVAEHLGTGLSGGALRVSAKSVLTFELPVNASSWALGAEAARAVADGPAANRPKALAELGRAMCLAHGHDPAGELFEWWYERVSAACLTRGAKIV